MKRAEKVEALPSCRGFFYGGGRLRKDIKMLQDIKIQRKDFKIDPIDIYEGLNKLKNLWLEEPKKFKNPYYPPRVRRTIRCKNLTHRTKKRGASSTQKISDSGGDDDGEPAARYKPQIIISNCTINIGEGNNNINDDIKQRQTHIAELKIQLAEAQRRINALEQINAELETQVEKQRQPEHLSTRRKNSYLKIIAALCGTTGKINPTAREATGKLKAAIEQLGFSLSDDTIRDILKETQQIIKQESRIRI